MSSDSQDDALSIKSAVTQHALPGLHGREAVLPGNPPLVGTITGVRTVDGAALVEVFLSKNDRRWVPVDEVELVPLEPEVRVIERDEFLRRLLLY